MADPLVITGGTDRSITFKIDTTQVRAIMAGLPKVAYFWTRDFLGRSFGQHRAKWLSSKSTKFGRGTEGGKSIRVSQVNEGSSGALQPNEVRYRVEPREKRQPTSAAAARGLDAMVAAVDTDNMILPVHEFGGTIRSQREMFVPVKTRPGSFGKWRAAHPSAKLLLLPSKRGGGNRLIYEAQRRRAGRGRPPKDAPPAAERLRLRWILTRSVTMRPTLKLYDSWDQLASQRDANWREAADKMIRDAAKGDPRNL